MKLRTLSEDDLLTAVQRNTAKAYGTRPRLHAATPYNAMQGLDAASKAAGMTLQPTGVPHKPRHRRYFSLTGPNT